MGTPKLLDLSEFKTDPERAAQALRDLEDLRAFRETFGASAKQLMMQTWEDYMAGVRRALETGDRTGVAVEIPGVVID